MNRSNGSKISYILIASGASLWGTIGIFIKALYGNGLSSMEIVTLRAVSASLILIIYSLLKDRSLLKIHYKDLGYFAGTGILSMVFFNWCYFTTIEETSISAAVVLLYTAPLFVIIISKSVFNEPITLQKIAAMIITIAGCSLISGLLPGFNLHISAKGLLTGIGSGFGYALYSIFAKAAGKKYAPITITTYTFIFAASFLLAGSFLFSGREIDFSKSLILYTAALGILPTAMAYILYTSGLKYVDTGKAAIIANIEPLVAIFIGTAFFGDRMTLYQAAGGMLILLSVLIAGKNSNRSQP